MSAPIIKVKKFTFLGHGQKLDFGFDPDLVILKKSGSHAVWAHRYTWRGRTPYFANAAAHDPDSITAFVHHGVMFGTDPVNAVGAVAYCIAIADNNSGFLKIGGYRGNDAASPGQTIEVGHEPGFVCLKRDNTALSYFTYNGATGAWPAASGDGITELVISGTGFIVDQVDGTTSDPTNDAGGEGYDWFSLENNSAYMDVLAWAGNDTDDRSIDSSTYSALGHSVTWTPCATLLKRKETGAHGFIKTDDIEDDAAGNSANFSTGALAGNNIQAHEAGGIQVGSTGFVNTTPNNYFALILKENDVSQINRPKLKTTGKYWLEFDGTGGVVMPVNEDFDLTGSQTWEILVRPGATHVSNLGTLFSRSSTAGAGQVGAYINSTAQSSDLNIFQDDAVYANNWRTGLVLPERSSFVIHWIYDATTDEQYVYKNGHMCRKTTGNGDADSTAAMSITSRTGYQVTLGCLNDSGSPSATSPFIGAIGGARVYSRALSAVEIMARSNSAIRNHQDSITDYLESWECTDGSGTTLTASSNAANNGTITNGTWIPR